MSNCSLCGSASVSTHQENETIQYKSGFVTALLPYSVCDECDYEFVSTEQIKASDALIREAKKAYDGLYTSEEIKAAREGLGLSQAEAAELFGGGRNAFSKYERGEVAQSVAMDRLIKLCVQSEETFENLKQLAHGKAGIVPMKVPMKKRNTRIVLQFKDHFEELLDDDQLMADFSRSSGMNNCPERITFNG